MEKGVIDGMLTPYSAIADFRLFDLDKFIAEGNFYVSPNVFILSGIAKEVPMYAIFRGVYPFWEAMLVCIILSMVFP